jgi:hypothetical protein
MQHPLKVTMAIHDSVINEMKSKPVTMVLILALWAAVAFMWASQTNYAMAADLTSVKAQLDRVESTVERASKESQLRGITTELFNLQQQVTAIRSKGGEPDRIYLDRISDLINDQAQLTRELAALR